MAWSTVAFNVSVRLDEQTMNKLDFLAEVEGVPRGRFVRMALEDYLSGMSVEEHPALAAYTEYQVARGKEKVIARSAWIQNWKRKNIRLIRAPEGQKET